MGPSGPSGCVLPERRAEPPIQRGMVETLPFWAKSPSFIAGFQYGYVIPMQMPSAVFGTCNKIFKIFYSSCLRNRFWEISSPLSGEHGSVESVYEFLPAWLQFLFLAVAWAINLKVFERCLPFRSVDFKTNLKVCLLVCFPFSVNFYCSFLRQFALQGWHNEGYFVSLNDQKKKRQRGDLSLSGEREPLFICMTVYLSACVSVCLSLCLPTCLPAYLLALHACLSILVLIQSIIYLLPSLISLLLSQFVK